MKCSIGSRSGKFSPTTALAFVLTVFVGAGLSTAVAHAQSWPSWPWSSQPQRPPAPAPRPPSAPRFESPPPESGPATSSGRTPRERFCAELEQRLAQSATNSRQSRDQIPQIEAQMRQAERNWRRAEQQLEQSDCFDYFLFSKTLRRTPQCRTLAQQAEETKRQFGELQAQRQSLLGTRDVRSTQDELIDALARNGCGQNYQQEAARRQRDNSNPFGFLWQGDEEGGRGDAMSRSGSLPFNTFRTVCVRSCDGYYFPVSYSTTQSQFDKDARVCQSKCAAPAELYYHQNPGAEMEQAMSIAGKPYSQHPNAFRHRKEFVPGCSCRVADYKPDLFNGKAVSPERRPATPPAPPAPAPQRRASTSTGSAPSSATSDDVIAQTIERSRR
jgi:hypothetical protein